MASQQSTPLRIKLYAALFLCVVGYGIVLLFEVLAAIAGTGGAPNPELEAALAEGRELTLARPSLHINTPEGIMTSTFALPGINDHGFRSPSFEEDALGRKTVMFIGDSFTWGAYADPIDQCFVDLVRDAGYKTINLGIPAAGPAQYKALAKRCIPLLRPDLVCVMVYPGNDFQFEPPVTPGYLRGYDTNLGFVPAYDPQGHQLSFSDAAENYYYKFMPRGMFHSLSAYLSLSNLRRLAAGMRTSAPAEPQNAGTAAERLASITHIARDSSVPAQFYILPVRPSLSTPLQNEGFAATALASVSPLTPPAFEESDYFEQYDGHFNNSGHAKMADFILKHLPPSNSATLDLEKASLPPVPSLQEMEAHLRLNEAQISKYHEELVALQERIAVLLFTPCVDGDSPAEKALALVDGDPTLIPEQVLQEQMKAMPIGHESAYSELASNYVSNFRETLADTLSAEQLDKLAAIPDIRIWRTYAGALAMRRLTTLTAQQRTAAIFGDINLMGALPWADFRAALKLDPAQEARVKQHLNILKQKSVDLIAQPAVEGHSVLDELVTRLYTTKGDAAAVESAIDAYSKNHPQSQPDISYTDLLLSLDQQTRDQLRTVLHEEQLELLHALALPQLSSVDTGFDPLGDAISTRLSGDTNDLVAVTVRAKAEEAQVELTPDGHLSFEDFAQILALNQEQKSNIQTLIINFKNESIEIMARPSSTGAKPPITQMAEAIIATQNPLMSDLLKAELRPGQSYVAALADLEEIVKQRVLDQLSESQRKSWDRLPVFNIINIDIGEDSVRRAVFDEVEKLSATETDKAPATLAHLTAALSLSDSQSQQVRGLLNELKDQNHALLSRPPAQDLPSPLAYLEERKQTNPETAAADFVHYATTHNEPESSRPYTDLLGESELRTREDLVDLLDINQRARFLKLELGSLAGIETGHTPGTAEPAP